MQKKLLLFIINFSFCSLVSFAQLDTLEDEFIENCIELYGTGEYARLNTPTNITSYGLKLFLPVGDQFSVNYKFTFGGTTNNDFYLHATLGSFLGLKIFEGVNRSDWGLFAFILSIVPEGISYHGVINKNFKIVGYVNPLGFDYTHNRDTKTDKSIGCFEFGINPTFTLMENALITPGIGYKVNYDRGVNNGLLFNMSVGWRFISSAEKEYY